MGYGLSRLRFSRSDSFRRSDWVREAKSERSGTREPEIRTFPMRFQTTRCVNRYPYWNYNPFNPTVYDLFRSPIDPCQLFQSRLFLLVYENHSIRSQTMRRILWIISVAVTLFSSITYGETLSYTDLIGRFTDLERLAVLPAPGENCGQWSSYDRASQYNTATEQYQRWEANGDGEGIIRKEGDRLVLAEMTGPGAFVGSGRRCPRKATSCFILMGRKRRRSIFHLPGCSIARSNPLLGRPGT